MARQSLVMLLTLFPAMCSLASARRSGFDAVSLIQRNDLAIASLVQNLDDAQRAETYRAVGKVLAANKNLSHSNHIMDYVASKNFAPTLGTSGCLYLPSDLAWKRFYEYVEHPYPPLFAELIANAYDPGCSQTPQREKSEFCPDGHVMGSHWQFREGPGRSPLGKPTGCVQAKSSGVANGIQVFETEGHVGLPGKWLYHIDTLNRRGAKPKRREAKARQDKCSNSEYLPQVPLNKKLVFPTRFIVCSVDDHHAGIDEAMIKDQVAWMSKSYAGKSPWTEEWFDHGRAPPQVDMQIEFELKDIKFVKDPECAQRAFTDMEIAAKHNTDSEKFFTVVVVSDDQSGILGMAEFPFEVDESDPVLLVLVSTTGLRQWSSKTGQWDLTYDEGDTAVHEGGHSLGLYHTFEGGCDVNGDQVADTPPEEFPTYSCDDGRSCRSEDPVHDFMDYSPDTCMAGFTEQQKRRVWCITEHYRPSLYGLALASK